MRYLIVLSALVVALAAAGAASGWRLGDRRVCAAPPEGTAAGDTWKPEITILQHGRTPLGGLTPVVTISAGEICNPRTFMATETSETGIYEASVVFPAGGEVANRNRQRFWREPGDIRSRHHRPRSRGRFATVPGSAGRSASPARSSSSLQLRSASSVSEG